VVKIGNVRIGEGFVVIAGPCAVESRDQMMKTAEAVKKAGADMLRGGAFKPRTSPHSFQGLGEEGLKILREAGDAFDMPVVTEVLDPRHVSLVSRYADVLQIGARNMQNFPLLREVGRSGMPVLLKRGMSSTIEEWLSALDYILLEGNDNVILCERGIRTFSDSSRFTLDIAAVPALRELTILPVIVDPSHAAGRRELVLPLARAAKAVGADGIMVEVHPDPDKALSDGRQSLSLGEFRKMMEELRKCVL
jgi:3-deoxy-7-phosphoheptulonate synthase